MVGILAYPWDVSLYRLTDPTDLVAPTILAAFDGWVDSGSAATTAAELLAEGGTEIATSTPTSCSTTARAVRRSTSSMDGWPS